MTTPNDVAARGELKCPICNGRAVTTEYSGVIAVGNDSFVSCMEVAGNCGAIKVTGRTLKEAVERWLRLCDHTEAVAEAVREAEFTTCRCCGTIVAQLSKDPNAICFECRMKEKAEHRAATATTPPAGWIEVTQITYIHHQGQKPTPRHTALVERLENIVSIRDHGDNDYGHVEIELIANTETGRWWPMVAETRAELYAKISAAQTINVTESLAQR